MRILAWILGFIAFTGTVFLSVSGIRAHRGAQRANAAVSKAQGDLADWQMVAELDIKNHDAAVENDELELQNDDLDVQSAGLQGRSVAKAQAQRSVDQMKLVVDESTQRLDELDSALGPDSRVSSAMERVQAAQQSLSIYSEVLTRDEHLAYAAAAIWLAFGFAMAFGAQQRKLKHAV